MSVDNDSTFGKLRSFFWPIHRHEISKILPMLAIIFLICFNYSILRNLKDAIVVTTSGAEVIPFIKVWAMFPGAIFLTVLFTRLSIKYSQERVFYIMITIFLIGYGLFAFILYPFRDYIHPNAFAETLSLYLPEGFRGLIATVCNWSFTIFYVLCELWGSLIMNVIFWGFANEVTRIHEARRFYSVFSIFSNIAAIVAGQAANYMNFVNPTMFFSSNQGNSWQQTMMLLITVVIICGLLIMYIFRWMTKNILTGPSFDEFHQSKREFKKKRKMSVRESFKYLSQSKYLVCIALMVLAYNLTINLVEVVWKDRLRELYPEPADFNKYLNNLTSSVGIVATITSIFMSRIIGKYGWTKTALITPVIMLITSMGFFAFVIFEHNLSPLALAITGITPLAIAALFGGAQNCLSKAMKYSVFDATKEMAFIPLDHEVKLRGKAAIDGIGSRCGKSGGSLIHQGLILVFGSLTASAPIVAIIIIAAIAGWISSVRTLGVQFAEITKPEDPTSDSDREPDESLLTKPQPAGA